ncbi:ABC transporter permease [Sanguibacter antarcticus]|uniref:Oligopeptide transport system permease protein n=1 Tax=Sanguibacter antarcticus TaxID=372484 RepID=A0A2A9E545_9MICO|nr:ABC transporter permease [Sanguibacter antarcticus]PFG33766.1 oligopeptide transport system permease protein [Sanguibacter antarcticus]
MSESVNPVRKDLSGAATTARRPSQAHFVADLSETPLAVVDKVNENEAPSSLWGDAWRDLRGRALFWASAVLIVLVLAVAFFPGLFTSVDPRFCELRNSLGQPQSGHPFGFDRQGCDVYSRVIYGARASVTVGILTTLGVVLLGTAIGAIAGFYGGWFDTILSRVTDIFFAIPLVLAAIVFGQVFQDSKTVLNVVAILSVFGWPQVARITRGAVLAVKNNDFITAAKALGASKFETLLRHVIPNAAAPIIVIATVSLGIFIVAEATLSFLGIGLPQSVLSWGHDISTAQTSLRTNASVLFYPSAALAITVLSFIMMGDAVRDALDPKARKR